MIVDSQVDHVENTRLFNKPAFKFTIILLLFVTAFAVRLYHINRPALDIAAIRQYQNAHIARGLYYEANDNISETRKEIARLNMTRMGFVLEPRIIENAAVLGYRIMGAENLWIPRVLSSVFWIFGGILLYLIARNIFSPVVALFSTAFYLFLPFSILASRSFQPDPLMVMIMLLSIHRVVKYDETPSLKNLVIAAIFTGVAAIIKPYCIFIIFFAFFSLVVLRMGFWKAIFNRNTAIYTILIVLPATLYYGYNLLTNTGFLGDHVQGSFLPHLLLSPPFWEGWLSMIGQVVGYIAFVFALFGLFKAQQGRPKALLTGLWIGYFLFGLSATYQIHTHSYYTLPFIPVIALSLGSVATNVINRATPKFASRLRIIVVTMVILASLLGLSVNMSNMPLKNVLLDYKSELKTVAMFTGINPQFRKFLADDFKKEVKVAKEIGEHVGHSVNTVFLTPHFGRVIAYYGEFGGLPWPTSESLYARKVRGAKVPDIEKDFTPDHIMLLFQGRFIKYAPDFFIITAFEEFEKQSDLRKVLYGNYSVYVQNDDYLIFDLRGMSD